jgi:hypothetical protein
MHSMYGQDRQPEEWIGLIKKIKIFYYCKLDFGCYLMDYADVL